MVDQKHYKRVTFTLPKKLLYFFEDAPEKLKYIIDRALKDSCYKEAPQLKWTCTSCGKSSTIKTDTFHNIQSPYNWHFEESSKGLNLFCSKLCEEEYHDTI